MILAPRYLRRRVAADTHRTRHRGLDPSDRLVG